MNVACPACSTVYRIDPDRVPHDGAATRCRECDAPFRIEPGTSRVAGVVSPATPVTPTEPEPAPADAAPAHEAPPTDEPTAEAPEVEPEGEPEPEERAPAPPVFGPQDPKTRARRLARALVSDIKVYNPDRWEESRREGTLRSEFRDDILKSWEEYVEQVGEPMAKKTPFFRDALNDILASGERVF